MAQGGSITRRFFSMRSFIQTLILGALVFAGIVLGIYLNQTKTLENLESRLASQTVLLEEADLSETPALIEPEEASHPEESSHDAADEPLEEKHIHKVPAEEPREPGAEEVHHDTSREDSAASKAMAITSLPAAPVKGLSERGRFGLLPVVRESDQLSPFQAYARPFPNQKAEAKISVVVLDYGLSEIHSETALALPADVTLALSPYSINPQGWVDKARAAGHEVWISMPMETQAFPAQDPGPRAIMGDQFLETNEENMNWVLASATGYSGVAVVHDDTFSDHDLMIGQLFKGIYKRGLGLANLDINSRPLAATVAEDLEAPYVGANFSAEDLPLGNLLELAEANALNGEKAVFAVEPTPSALDLLKQWSAVLPEKDISLVPLSSATAFPVPEFPAALASPAEAEEHQEEHADTHHDTHH